MAPHPRPGKLCVPRSPCGPPTYARGRHLGEAPRDHSWVCHDATGRGKTGLISSRCARAVSGSECPDCYQQYFDGPRTTQGFLRGCRALTAGLGTTCTEGVAVRPTVCPPKFAGAIPSPRTG